MPFPGRVLADDEDIVVHRHPHTLVLVVPAVLVPLVVGVVAFGVAVMPPGDLQTPGRSAVVGVGLVFLFAFSFLPWLRWRTTHFVLTTRRVILRVGVLSRSGRDIPLRRITDVAFSHSLVERLLGCGTLTIESGGERGQLVLTDVPDVEDVQRELCRLLDRPAEPDPDPASPPDQRRPAGAAGAPDAALAGE